MIDLGKRILDGLEASKRKKAGAAGGPQEAPIEDVVAQIEDAPRPVAAPALPTIEPVKPGSSVDLEAFQMRLDRISQRMKYGDRK